MAKIAFVGDCHFRAFAQFASIDPETGLNSRLRDGLDILSWLAQKPGIDAFVFLGDIFDERRRIDTATVSNVVAGFRRFKVPVFCLVGNHDINQAYANDNTLKVLPDNVKVIDQPKCLLICGQRIGFIPYIHDTAAFKKEAASFPDLDIFCFHQALSEGKLGAYGATLDYQVSVADLPKANIAIGGHYHFPHEVAPGIHYAGSVMQLNFGERGEKKRIMLYDTSTSEFDSVPTVAPEFHLYDGLSQAKAGKHNERDFIKIVCSKAEAREAREAFPDAQVEVRKELKTERRTIAQEATVDDAVLLKDFLKERKPEGLAMDKLEEMGKALLNA